MHDSTREDKLQLKRTRMEKAQLVSFSSAKYTLEEGALAFGDDKDM